MNLHDQDIIRIAKKEAAEETTRNCLEEGDSPEKVSRCTGLSLDQVMELQKQIAAKN